MNMPASKISVFIVGAQKAGTTALYTFLQEHPSLQFGYKKELHLFNQPAIDQCDIDREVQKCFSQKEIVEPTTLRVDATPMYLYHPLVMERLYRYNPDAKIIVLLRDPSDRAFSHWKMTTKMGRESFCFSKVIRFGRSRFDDFHPVFSYVERGFYAAQLDRVLEYFPREQVCVLEQSALLNRHNETLHAVTQFLNIAPFTHFPASKMVASNHHATKLSKQDRLYLDLMYQESNQRLASEWGIHFSKVASDHVRVVLKPLLDMDATFDGRPGVERLKCVCETISADSSVSSDDEDGNVVAHIVPWIFSDAFIEPMLPKIRRMLKKRQIPVNNLLLYGRLPDLVYKMVDRHCNSMSSGAVLPNAPCVLFIESKLSMPFNVADHIVCLRNQVLRHKRRPQDFASPPPRLTVGPEIEVTDNCAVGYCAQRIKSEELHMLKEAARQGVCTLEVLSCDGQGRIEDWSTAFVFCSQFGDDPLSLVYQSLRAGRIPVWMDAGLALPLERELAYDACTIQSKEWKLLFERVALWSSGSSDGDLQNRQRVARALWVEQLVFPQFWRRIWSSLQKVLGNYLS